MGRAVKGYDEAAALANHYVNGDGNDKRNPYRINATVYKNSKIVIATMKAMRLFITELHQDKKSFLKLSCSNATFRSKPYAKPLLRMNFQTEGKMKSNGVLEAAQQNQRLHKADGHFYLEATSQLLLVNKKERIKTIWSVESEYDFESFDDADYYTTIPLGSSKLTLYDGLSQYMTEIGVAKAFWYKAQWLQVWDLKK